MYNRYKILCAIPSFSIVAFAVPCAAQVNIEAPTKPVAPEGKAPPVDQFIDTILPPKTELLLQTTSFLNSSTLVVGQKIALKLSYDVNIDGAVAIPRGTPAFARVATVNGKGMFGKAGLIKLDMVSIDLNGRSYAISGHLVQQGALNLKTMSTAVAVAGPLGGMLSSGGDALIDTDRTIIGFTEEAIPVRVAHKPAEVDQTPELFRVDSSDLTRRN